VASSFFIVALCSFEPDLTRSSRVPRQLHQLWYTLIMAKQGKLDAVFYRSASGNEPVRDWLKSLTKEDRKAIGDDIQTVQYGWPLGMPLVDHIESGIWEVRTALRSGIARTLFMLERDTIVLLHGFIKKTRATPDHDKAIARSRKRDIERAR
jgi:phage-related protein